MEYRNGKRLSGARIDCEINHPKYGWIPFTCDPQDTGAQFDVADLYRRLSSDPTTAAYIPPTREEVNAAAAKKVRLQRDRILAAAVDPLVSNPLRWADLSVEQQEAWADYRRALLNIPQQSGFPTNVTWPIKPE
jgi:hypothetical protein